MEKLDYLEEEIRRRDRELEQLQSTVEQQKRTIARLQQEKKKLERRLEKRDKPLVPLSEKDRNHYGDARYWTGKRLYALR